MHDIFREFMSIYLGVAPHHHHRLPRRNSLFGCHTLKQPGSAKQVAWAEAVVTSLVTYHLTTSVVTGTVWPTLLKRFCFRLYFLLPYSGYLPPCSLVI